MKTQKLKGLKKTKKRLTFTNFKDNIVTLVNSHIYFKLVKGASHFHEYPAYRLEKAKFKVLKKNVVIILLDYLKTCIF